MFPMILKWDNYEKLENIVLNNWNHIFNSSLFWWLKNAYVNWWGNY